MKNHLKRLAAPKNWVLDKRVTKYVIKPNAGAHSLDKGLALGFILRDMLHLADRMDEVKKILATTDIMVDGVIRREHRYMVGLFDVLSIPALQKHYRVVLDSKGRITIVEIAASEAGVKVSKVVGKSVVAGGKIQVHLHDGRNLLSDAKIAVGDSVVISIPKLAVKEVLKAHKGACVYLFEGKHAGDVGVLDEVKDDLAVYTSANKTHSAAHAKVKGKVITSSGYIFVVGASGKPVCTVVPK